MTDDPTFALLEPIYPHLEKVAVPAGAPGAEYILFFSYTNGRTRARVETFRGPTLAEAWRRGTARLRKMAAKNPDVVRWLRVDIVDGMRQNDWGTLKQQLVQVKRNYCRQGISLDPSCRHAFLETEINANAMFYGGPKYSHCVVNEKNFRRYARLRHGLAGVDLDDGTSVWMFSTRGFFVDGDAPGVVHEIAGPGRSAGRRIVEPLSDDVLSALIESSSSFLTGQVGDDGRFIYGWHPCFDREINAYNGLRHASTTYAMIEAWEVTQDEALWAAIERSLAWLCREAIRTIVLPDGTEAAFLVDVGNEIKLGANAVAILAFTRHAVVTGCRDHLPLLEKLALGVQYMQRSRDGSFVHVLNYPDLTLKEAFRTIYYEGEAAFGLMRLYSLTRDERWLQTVEKAFEHFIAKEHWKHNDHWLSYCVNELTRYRPDERYFRFGIQNVRDYLDFVLNRITTFPTLLELMMAAQAMLDRIGTMPDMRHLLDEIDLPKFQRALHFRARYLLNGFFWPELAMFFAHPQRIAGSFFIRHHAFRVRIDDVEHYLSGLIAYVKHLRLHDVDGELQELQAVDDPTPSGPVVTWGGDVNLGRRQHYRTAQLGVENVLDIPAMRSADLRIVNLECVVATLGEQGVRKGEDGPYYYRARPEMLRVLGEAGIEVVTTANNHSGDYGTEALLEQRRWLDLAGIGHSGTGRHIEDALTPVIRRAGKLNIAIFSLDATQPKFAATADQPGSAYLSLSDPELWRDTMAPRIKAARAKAHVVLVAMHWGQNLADEPEADELAVGRILIDAGADAILGASAHVLQGVEIHDGRPIIHDAGDLLFDSVRSTPGEAGLFSLELSVNGVERVTFTPLAGGFGYTGQVEGADAAAATLRFASKCKKMGTELALTASGGGTISLSPPPRAATRIPEAPIVRYAPLRPENIGEDVEARWKVDEIPEEACIEPVQFGPLTLLGVRVQPSIIRRRRMLWVETFWRADAPVDEDIRLDMRAVPVAPTAMKPWGIGMDHDPCDWLLPTTRWKPGQIYRDYYGLRPPYLKNWDNVALQLTIGIVSEKYAVPALVMPHRIELAVPKAALPGAGTAARSYREEFPDTIRDCEPGQTWTARQLEVVTGGTWLVKPPAEWHVRSVIRGSAHADLVDEPTLYVASDYDTLALHEQYSTKSKKWDRHETLKRRADRLAGAIVARPVRGLPKDFPLLQVDDPIKALVELGLAARQRFSGEVIAVTGTAGKSTTVGMLKHVLGEKKSALASFGNYNSRVGAPAVMANLSMDHEAAIIEVAQSALWMERGPVTRMVRPTIALITEIGISQTDKRVRSIEDTVKWKTRVFDGLTGQATAIVGEHLTHFEMVVTAARVHANRIVTFGTSEQATLRVVDRVGGAVGSHIKFRAPGSELIDLEVPVPGLGMANNAMAVMSILYAMGHDLQAAARVLATYLPDEGRMQRMRLPAGTNGAIELIDDSWNATISSMRNALSVLAETPVPEHGRKIAVLGRVVHLGELSRSLHESLAEPVLASDPALVVTHGEEMQHLRTILPQHLLGPHFSDAPTMASYLAGQLREGDLVLVKGSRRDSDFGEVCRLLDDLSTKFMRPEVVAE